MDRFGLAGTSQIRIGGLFDTLAFFKQGNMFRQKAPFKSIGMVKIDILAFFNRYVASMNPEVAILLHQLVDSQ